VSSTVWACNTTSLEAEFQVRTRQRFTYLIILLLKCLFRICFIFSPKVITRNVAHVVQSIAC